ncbi:MAG: branched-chain amino acid ABC transporter permease [Rhodobacterales bacterium]|nr:branched-chain amino acid ABC transporter permease [Rhodobacterales bacterium]
MSAYFWADLATTLFNAAVLSMSVFIFASGLALILGILKILNFAHGALFAVGAYLVYSMVGWIGGEANLVQFIIAVVAAGLVLGVIGLAADMVIFRRIREIDYHYSLIATYALLLFVEGLIKLIWGVDFKSVSTPPEIDGALIIGMVVMPWLSVFAVIAGVVAFFGLEYLLNRTVLGKLMQSVAVDPWMANALGINVPRIYTAIVVVSFALAGLAGGLLAPATALTPGMGIGLSLYAFGALVVGGMGNIRGAFLASIGLCTLDTFASFYLHLTPGIAFFVAIALILAIRPTGFARGVGL